MSPENTGSLEDIRFDGDNLYREENYSDMHVGSIRRMVPVKKDGSEDTARRTLFIGQAHLMSQMGPIPVQAEIEAETLEQAIAAYPEAIREAIQRMAQEAREAQRDQASRIVVPEAGGAAPGNIHLK